MEQTNSPKMYFAGCSGIAAPVDAHNNLIKVGDKLSWNFHEDYYKPEDVDDWMRKAIFIVEEHPSGDGLCAKGIHKELYLHDFKFKYCEIVKTAEL